MTAFVLVTTVSLSSPDTAPADDPPPVADAPQAANEDAAAPDAPAGEDPSGEVATGLMAIVGVALLGLVMLAVAILGGNRVRRLARHTGRRGEPPSDQEDDTSPPLESDELPEETPPHPEQNGKPSLPDHP
ncbi:MAG: hypothetical protein ACF8PG_12185 [Maioricimonas sp. JB045]